MFYWLIGGLPIFSQCGFVLSLRFFYIEYRCNTASRKCSGKYVFVQHSADLYNDSSANPQANPVRFRTFLEVNAPDRTPGQIWMDVSGYGTTDDKRPYFSR
jgi:hypothetical protein